MLIVADQLAAESSHDPGEDDPDLAGADYCHRTADEIRTQETVELEIALNMLGRSPPVEGREGHYVICWTIDCSRASSSASSPLFSLVPSGSNSPRKRTI